MDCIGSNKSMSECCDEDLFILLHSLKSDRLGSIYIVLF